MIRRAGLAVLLLATAAAAGAPDTSLRPVSREDVFPPALPSFAPDESVRPKARTTRSAPVAAAANTRTSPDPLSKTLTDRGVVPASSPRDLDPEPRETNSASRVRSTRVGKVCKDRNLRGLEVGAVAGRLSGCGIDKGAIRLYEVSGVKLSTPAVMECDTARALKKWVDGGMSKSVKRYGGGVVELKVAAGYACRTRNNRPGAKISEHGKGRAIDISALHLKNGDTISVLRDWGKGRKGKMLRRMHKQACGPFGTVLGPNADRYHKDHFHFDIAKHRGGPYCR
ncbi:extensin family protein [Shimia sp. SDUM112013]|uniref:extensin-like domain-containing protein n=1 Tax=Shimia sp. SDUM112013 TaxID=3136160 RepID=UPI0032F06EA3